MTDEFNFEEDDDGHEQESKNENENENRNGKETNTTYENIELLYRFREHVDNWVEENNSTSKYEFLSHLKISHVDFFMGSHEGPHMWVPIREKLDCLTEYFV